MTVFITTPENEKAHPKIGCAPRHFTADFYPCNETKARAFIGSNAVGYTSGTVNKNLYIAVPVQFLGVGATDGKIAVKNLLKEANPGTGESAAKASADKILVWDSNTGYTTYFLNKSQQWCKEGETTETEATVSLGAAVFYKKGSLKAGSFTMSGEVATGTDSVTVTLKKNLYSFVANPWPTAMSVKDIGALITPAGTGASADKASADKILRWSPDSGYITYYHQKSPDCWMKDDGTEETKDVINAGEGFFIKKGSLKDGTITFTKPAGL